MIDLIPTPNYVMRTLTETGAYRKGHFVYPNGKHAAHYFQMPLAFRHYDNARILGVGLSRIFRMEKSISSRVPKISVISPGPGGIAVAFPVREALGAEQIYWLEKEDGKRQFRQFLEKGMVHPAIIVDDIIRSGRAIQETVDLVQELGAEVIGIGTIVRFTDGPTEFGGVPVRSLMEFDVDFYDTAEALKSAEDVSGEAEAVRF
jgi:orotate phosphoribosyltransferase